MRRNAHVRFGGRARETGRRKRRNCALVRPYDAAAVFAVDEKPQIQALNRTAPILPMLPTTPQRASHDYERNGTVDLFAAMDIAKGTVITDIKKRHTQVEFIAFLNKINREVPAELDVHVILD